MVLAALSGTLWVSGVLLRMGAVGVLPVSEPEAPTASSEAMRDYGSAEHNGKVAGAGFAGQGAGDDVRDLQEALREDKEERFASSRFLSADGRSGTEATEKANAYGGAPLSDDDRTAGAYLRDPLPSRAIPRGQREKREQVARDSHANAPVARSRLLAVPSAVDPLMAADSPREPLDAIGDVLGGVSTTAEGLDPDERFADLKSKEAEITLGGELDWHTEQEAPARGERQGAFFRWVQEDGFLAKGDRSVPARAEEQVRNEEVEPGSVLDENATEARGPEGLLVATGQKKTRSEAPKPAPVPASPPRGLDEKDASREPFSTFSLHVSDVSFKLAQAALAKGQWPDPGRIRIEELVNAFDYGDPTPTREARVSCRLEQSAHPFLQQRNLLRISMRTAATGRAGGTPLRLTLLLDSSGSMERLDRRETVRRAFVLLAAQLEPIDEVTLIAFARRPRLVADRVGGGQGERLVRIVSELPSEGGTNLEAALALAFEKAQEQRTDKAQNRIVLITDGAANLGDADPESLARIIESMRQAGIAFDAAGIGADGLNDEILEALTRKGDGRYYLLDRPEDADAGFAHQIAGALRPAARNVKVQVELNPDRVGRYKLLGFEKHRLKKEDFRDDSVDAAEMAAEEAGVALYQLEARRDGQGDVGSVSVRFQDMASGRMVERRWPIPYEPRAPRLAEAAPSLRLAAVAALFAARLKGEALGQSVELPKLAGLISGLPPRFRDTARVDRLAFMIEQARQMDTGEGR